jgi:DNA-binding PadR family transcriptional regulator
MAINKRTTFEKEIENMFGPKAMKGYFRGGHGPGFGHGPRRGRMFERGDLKYVILDMLKDEPAHGYEIIRRLEERSRGFYSPSPGSVYPALQLFEDMGYVTYTQHDGKKVYVITDEGRSYLEENRRSVDAIWSRVGGGWNPQAAAEMHEIRHDLMALGKLFGQQMHEGNVDHEKMVRVREVISTASRQIEDILRDREA